MVYNTNHKIFNPYSQIKQSLLNSNRIHCQRVSFYYCCVCCYQRLILLWIVFEIMLCIVLTNSYRLEFWLTLTSINPEYPYVTNYCCNSDQSVLISLSKETRVLLLAQVSYKSLIHTFDPKQQKCGSWTWAPDMYSNSQRFEPMSGTGYLSALGICLVVQFGIVWFRRVLLNRLKSSV